MRKTTAQNIQEALELLLQIKAEIKSLLEDPRRCQGQARVQAALTTLLTFTEQAIDKHTKV